MTTTRCALRAIASLTRLLVLYVIAIYTLSVGYRISLARSLAENFYRGGRITVIAGIDEVGRGCLAGPVFAAAVVIDTGRFAKLADTQRRMIRDSKTLSPKQRTAILPVIIKTAQDYSIGMAQTREIEQLGIVKATFLAMRRAVTLLMSIDLLVVDGRATVPGIDIRQQAVVNGDRLVPVISAASIVAKVARDQYMTKQGQRYPQYGFAQHVGYGTAQHFAKIAEHGICPLHRRNFSPIKELVAQ